MDRTAKKCIAWAVVCFTVATVIHMIWPLFISAGGDYSRDLNFLSGAAQSLLSVLQGVLVSVGGALVGAAVVVNWLTSRISVTKGPSSQLR